MSDGGAPDDPGPRSRQCRRPLGRELRGARPCLPHRQRLRLVKGSHIVVPRLFEGEQAYILQNNDRRIVFAIPYEGDHTLIGTTDETYEGDPAKVSYRREEIAYLCQVINDHFVKQISPADVVWTYAGVRPLHDDESASASAVTRDYVLELDDADGIAPCCRSSAARSRRFASWPSMRWRS